LDERACGQARSTPTSIETPGTTTGANDPAVRPFLNSVGVARRLAVNLNRRALKIDDPDLRHAEPGVKRKLGPAVIGERALGDFDEEENVGSVWMTPVIIIGAGSQEHEIGLGLVITMNARAGS
jgi:hypothetical protein